MYASIYLSLWIIDDDDKQKLVSLHAQDLSSEDSTWIKDKMTQHKTVEKSFVLASKLSNEAMSAMKDDEQLVGILQTMIQRSY